ncbi:unnamed protein product, partial [marine sediment metagenome]
AVDIVSDLLHQATGFDEYQRRKIAYYAVMTHYIKDFDPFPQMVVTGTPGTGKSASLNILKGTCGKVVSVTGETITDAALRAAMKEAEFGSLIVEEADDATQRDLENTLVTRYSKSSASNTKMVSDGRDWRLEKQGTYGATIFHRRNLFRSPALLRRVIIVRAKRIKGRFIPVTEDTHPDLFKEYRQQFGFRPTWPEVRNEWDIEPSILDCFRPIVALAMLIGDTAFLESLVKEMLEASNRLVEEESYLEIQVLLKALITLTTQKIKGVITEGRINLEVSKIDPTIKDEFGPSCPVLQLSANQRNRILREDLGFPIRSSHGRNRIYFTPSLLIEKCEANGIEDDCLIEWKVALGMAGEGSPTTEAVSQDDSSSDAWRTEEE